MTGRSFGKDYQRLEDWKMSEEISIKSHLEGSYHEIGYQFTTQE
jgi:hypothetical protein